MELHDRAHSPTASSNSLAVFYLKGPLVQLLEKANHEVYVAHTLISDFAGVTITLISNRRPHGAGFEVGLLVQLCSVTL